MFPDTWYFIMRFYLQFESYSNVMPSALRAVPYTVHAYWLMKQAREDIFRSQLSVLFTYRGT